MVVVGLLSDGRDRAKAPPLRVMRPGPSIVDRVVANAR